MTMIEELLAETYCTGDGDPEIALTKVDLGLLYAGKMVELIHNLVAFPPTGKIDDQAVAATARALLFYLGTLGKLVGALATPNDDDAAERLSPALEQAAADMARVARDVLKGARA